MDGRMLARLAALIFVGVAIAATAIELTREQEEPQGWALDRENRHDAEPLRAVLRRCRNMGEVALHDPACLKVWVENRERFLGRAAVVPPEAR